MPAGFPGLSIRYRYQTRYGSMICHFHVKKMDTNPQDLSKERDMTLYTPYEIQ